MSERFAILLNSLEPVDTEKLHRAFRGLPGLAPRDADSVCNEGGGVLCRGFSAPQASGLQTNLKAEGVEVLVIDEAQLPVLPPPRILRRVELKPDALFIDDLIKGMIPLPWDQVRLIAAGSVQLTTITRKRTEWEEMRTGHVHFGHGLVIPVPVTETKVGYTSKESADWHLRAEILLQGGSRYSIEAERFNFASLGEGVTQNLAGNFCLLVRGLAAHAPDARLNRGAAAIIADPCEFVYYPRKGAFHDEITWLMWKEETGAG